MERSKVVFVEKPFHAKHRCSSSDENPSPVCLDAEVEYSGSDTTSLDGSLSSLPPHRQSADAVETGMCKKAHSRRRSVSVSAIDLDMAHLHRVAYGSVDSVEKGDGIIDPDAISRSSSMLADHHHPTMRTDSSSSISSISSKSAFRVKFGTATRSRSQHTSDATKAEASLSRGVKNPFRRRREDSGDNPHSAPTSPRSSPSVARSPLCSTDVERKRSGSLRNLLGNLSPVTRRTISASPQASSDLLLGSSGGQSLEDMQTGVVMLAATLNDRSAAFVNPLDALTKNSWTSFLPEGVTLGKAETALEDSIWELVAGESNYVNNLITVSTFRGILNLLREKNIYWGVNCGRVFGEFDRVQESSLKLAQHWADHAAEWAPKDRPPFSVESVMSAFEDVESFLLPYEQYCAECETQCSYFKALCENDKRMSFIVHWCETSNRFQRRKVDEMLVEPMQRMTRYPLLLKRILNALEALGDARAKPFKETVDRVDAYMAVLHERLHVRCNQDHLMRIETSLSWVLLDDPCANDFIPPCFVPLVQEKDSFAIATPSREYLHEGPLCRISVGRHSNVDMYCFLFADVLILTRKPKNGIYNVARLPLDLDHTIIREVPDEVCKNAFFFLTYNSLGIRTFFATFQTQSSDEKETWMKQFAKSNMPSAYSEVSVPVMLPSGAAISVSSAYDAPLGDILAAACSREALSMCECALFMISSDASTNRSMSALAETWLKEGDVSEEVEVDLNDPVSSVPPNYVLFVREDPFGLGPSMSISAV